MHIVAVHVGELSVLRAYHTEDLRTVGVLRDVDNLAFECDILAIVTTILTEGLCLQFVDAIGGERHLLSKLATVGHCLVALRQQTLDGGPLLMHGPGVCSLAAVAQPQSFQSCILAVEVVHLSHHTTVLAFEFLVEHGVIDAQAYRRRCRHEVYAQRHWVALDGRVFL